MKSISHENLGLVYSEIMNFDEYKAAYDANPLLSAWVEFQLDSLKQSGNTIFLNLSTTVDSHKKHSQINAIVDQYARESVLRYTDSNASPQYSDMRRVYLFVSLNEKSQDRYPGQLIVRAIFPVPPAGGITHKISAVRKNLSEAGIFNHQKNLAIRRLNEILVISPPCSKVIADFNTYATALKRVGLCNFTYATALFNSTTVGQQLIDVIADSLDRGEKTGRPIDAIVLIRGGGKPGEIAYLNSQDLAEYICNLELPIITGIGHKEDTTIIDEVAFRSCGTASVCGHAIYLIATEQCEDDHIKQEAEHEMHAAVISR